MTSNDALTIILKQFQQTGDLEQAKEDITGIMSSALEDTFHDTCAKCRKDETHYLVDKGLLRRAFFQINRVIADKKKEGSLSEMDDDLMMVQLRFKDIIGYGD